MSLSSCDNRNHDGLDEVVSGVRQLSPLMGQDAAFLATQLAKLEHIESYFRNWNPFTSRGCPLCMYDEGKFIEECQFHAQVNKLLNFNPEM